MSALATPSLRRVPFSAVPGSGPPSVAGLAAWYRAGAGTRQTADGTPATADADPVGQWRDQGGSGRHLLQATASRRPVLKLDVQNDRPVIRFDGSNDLLQAASWGLAQPYTVFLAFSSTRVAGRVLMDGTTNDRGQLFHHAANPTLIPFAGSSGTGLAYTSGAFGILCITWNGASTAYRLNNGTDTTSDVGAANPGGVTLGGRADGTFPGTMDVAELLVYSGAVAAADKQTLHDYLNGLYEAY